MKILEQISKKIFKKYLKEQEEIKKECDEYEKHSVTCEKSGSKGSYCRLSSCKKYRVFYDDSEKIYKDCEVKNIPDSVCDLECSNNLECQWNCKRSIKNFERSKTFSI